MERSTSSLVDVILEGGSLSSPRHPPQHRADHEAESRPTIEWNSVDWAAVFQEVHEKVFESGALAHGDRIRALFEILNAYLQTSYSSRSIRRFYGLTIRALTTHPLPIVLQFAKVRQRFLFGWFIGLKSEVPL
jgi:hypothetical protein